MQTQICSKYTPIVITICLQEFIVFLKLQQKKEQYVQISFCLTLF